MKILLYALDITSILSAAKYGLGQHLPAVLSTIVTFQKVRVFHNPPHQKLKTHNSRWQSPTLPSG